MQHQNSLFLSKEENVHKQIKSLMTNFQMRKLMLIEIILLSSTFNTLGENHPEKFKAFLERFPHLKSIVGFITDMLIDLQTCSPYTLVQKLQKIKNNLEDKKTDLKNVSEVLADVKEKLTELDNIIQQYHMEYSNQLSADVYHEIQYLVKACDNTELVHAWNAFKFAHELQEVILSNITQSPDKCIVELLKGCEVLEQLLQNEELAEQINLVFSKEKVILALIELEKDQVTSRFLRGREKRINDEEIPGLLDADIADLNHQLTAKSDNNNDEDISLTSILQELENQKPSNPISKVQFSKARDQLHLLKTLLLSLQVETKSLSQNKKIAKLLDVLVDHEYGLSKTLVQMFGYINIVHAVHVKDWFADLKIETSSDKPSNKRAKN